MKAQSNENLCTKTSSIYVKCVLRFCKQILLLKSFMGDKIMLPTVKKPTLIEMDNIGT